MCRPLQRLGERRRQLAGSMSGGEQQICAMARAPMAASALMMIDEMCLGLGPVVTQQPAETRRQGVSGAGHAGRAGRACVMERGRVTLSEAARKLIDDAAVRQAYLGVWTGRAPGRSDVGRGLQSRVYRFRQEFPV
ncbi:MAG: hypothetical protein JSR53_00005, partial [Proteobacteria bacterium]|nr:hypothetical protein [Pseudomonadota bacterium]